MITVTTGGLYRPDYNEYVFSSPILHTADTPMLMGTEVYGVKCYSDRIEISKGDSIIQLQFDDIEGVAVSITHSLFYNMLFAAFAIMPIIQFSLYYLCLPFALLFGIISFCNKKVTIKTKDCREIKLYCTAKDHKYFKAFTRNLQAMVQ